MLPGTDQQFYCSKRFRERRNTIAQRKALCLRRSLSNFPPAMLSRFLYPLLLQWAISDVQIPTVEIAAGVRMPVMSIGTQISYQCSQLSYMLVQRHKTAQVTDTRNNPVAFLHLIFFIELIECPVGTTFQVPLLLDRHRRAGKIKCVHHCCELDQTGWTRN